jgi:hypothetical protein
MSTLNVYRVEFQVKKPSAGGAGKADQYRREVRSALVSAVSAHPKDILVPLTNNIALLTGEAIDILSVQSVHHGTEGAAVLS